MAYRRRGSILGRDALVMSRYFWGTIISGRNYYGLPEPLVKDVNTEIQSRAQISAYHLANATQTYFTVAASNYFDASGREAFNYTFVVIFHL